MATVRYVVTDVDQAVAFYSRQPDFAVQQRFGPNMAILRLGDLTLWLAGPSASAARPMPDGRRPEPGGWSRFVLEVADLAATVARLKAAGVAFRNEIVSPARAASRSWPRTRPGTWWSCSSRLDGAELRSACRGILSYVASTPFVCGPTPFDSGAQTEAQRNR